MFSFQRVVTVQVRFVRKLFGYFPVRLVLRHFPPQAAWAGFRFPASFGVQITAARLFAADHLLDIARRAIATDLQSSIEVRITDVPQSVHHVPRSRDSKIDDPPCETRHRMYRRIGRHFFQICRREAGAASLFPSLKHRLVSAAELKKMRWFQALMTLTPTGGRAFTGG